MRRLHHVGAANIITVLLSILIVLRIFSFVYYVCGCFVVRCISFSFLPFLISSFRLFLLALVLLVSPSWTASMPLPHLSPLPDATGHHTPSRSITPDTVTVWVPTGSEQCVS